MDKSSAISKGLKFRQALKASNPLILMGVINAYVAKMAQNLGFQAIYLSGAGVANACFGLPDLGLTSLRDVIIEVERITSLVDLPLIVDGDTGFGSDLNAAYAVQELIKAGAAGVHFEDQTWPKRCGHREGKTLIETSEMEEKIRSSVEIKHKHDPNFVIIARTDAIGIGGIDDAIKRAKAYVAVGADAVFAEAVTDLKQYAMFKKELGNIPLLANITEFGKTPLFNINELRDVGVNIALYPLSIFRIMNKAASDAMFKIKTQGTQKELIPHMQTREELYQILDYYSFEEKL